MSGKVLHRTLRIKDVPVGDSRVAAGDRQLTVHRSVSNMAYTRQMVVVVCVVSVGMMALLLYRVQTLNCQLSQQPSSGFLGLSSMWNEVKEVRLDDTNNSGQVQSLCSAL